MRVSAIKSLIQVVSSSLKNPRGGAVAPGQPAQHRFLRSKQIKPLLAFSFASEIEGFVALVADGRQRVFPKSEREFFHQADSVRETCVASAGVLPLAYGSDTLDHSNQILRNEHSSNGSAVRQTRDRPICCLTGLLRYDQDCRAGWSGR